MDQMDRANILIVDDLPEKVLVLESILEDLGQNLIVARSGPEALREVLAREFAVILLDVNMPDMDGFETATLIRQRRRSAHTPIIFITAFADEIHAARGYSLGAVDYILSPVVPEMLRTKVKVFVDLHLMAQQIRRQADERVALAREQAARAAAEENNRRAAFLAEASKVLASSLDVEATVRGLLHLTVPALADYSALTLASSDGRAGRTAWARMEPDGAIPHLGSVDSPDLLAPELNRVLAATLSAGERHGPVLIPPSNGSEPEATTPRSERIAAGPANLLSLLALPLLARGRALGVLLLGQGPSGRTFTEVDEVLAEELAGRAAIALDNAGLYRDVQEADRRKNEFLSMLAHELRNPLAPIRNATQILRLRLPDEPDLLAVRDIIDRQVEHLVRLVDDLLDISRITRGKIRLLLEPVDIASIVARALETSRPVIDERHHGLTVSLPQEPLRVHADLVRLAQVLSNLLNNAAKYTEDGGTITLTVREEDGEAVVRVRDTGMGIPAETLPHVFDLFVQAERSLDRSQGGLGVGLTLVRGLVEMHGGRVEAASDGPGRGSEFTVRLPALDMARIARPSANGNSQFPVGGARRRVLLVDDNADGAESLAMLLRISGHEVHVSHDGPAALAVTESFRPDVVFLDIGLPGMDGYEVARRLRELPGINKLILVALTGYGREEDQRRAHEAGFDYHLVKPADPSALEALFAAPAPACPHRQSPAVPCPPR
jgi:signal transduction histidine kinase/DNA-binding response OmpR family regulator